MSEMLNISRIKTKMTDKPIGQKLYLFFYGDKKMLTRKQIKEVKNIVAKEHKKTMDFLESAMSESK